MSSNNTSKNVIIDNGGFPGFAFFYSVFLFVGLNFLFLDGNYRVESLIKYLSAGAIISNFLVLLFPVTLIAFIPAVIMWMTEKAIYIEIGTRAAQPEEEPKLKKGLKKRKKEKEFGTVTKKRPAIKPGALTLFVFLALTAYVNLLYLKYFIVSFDNHVLSSTMAAVMTFYSKIVTALFILFIILLLVFFRKLNIPSLIQNVTSVKKAVFYIVIIAFLGVAFTAAVNHFKKPVQAVAEINPKGLPNILVITCDSLGARHMSVYGYNKKTTPNIEEMARESYVFKRMIANSNSTHFSLPCLLGKNPCNIWQYRTKPEETLLKILKDHGYEKRSYVSFFRFTKDFHDNFSDTTIVTQFDNSKVAKFLYSLLGRDNCLWVQALGSEKPWFFRLYCVYDPRQFAATEKEYYVLPTTLNYVFNTLKNSKKPAFVWAHVFEPHFPYVVPEPFMHKFGDKVIDLYDGNLLYIDDQFGKFIKRLKDANLYDNTIIIFSADHGEAFEESEHAGYKFFWHGGDWLNEEVNHIPFIMKTPHQNFQKKLETFAALVDFAPTILDILKIKIPGWMEGESLKPYMEDEKKLSEKIKTVAPRTYFIRKDKDFTVLPIHFLVKNADMFDAYKGKYKISWLQSYALNKGREGFYNVPLAYNYFSVINIFEDPDEKENLIFKKGSKEFSGNFDAILKEIFNDPAVKCYREGINKWGKINIDKQRTYIKEMQKVNVREAGDGER